LEYCIKIIRQWLKPKSLILDYGCGEGYLVDGLCREGFGAMGTDISETVLNKARDRFPRVFISLPNKHYFDAIVSFDVLEHVFDFDELFDYFNGHLKPQGILIITTNDFCFMKMLAIGLFFMDTFFDPYSPHIRFFTGTSLRRLLEMKGYTIIHIERRGNFCGVFSTGQTVVARRI
jgi:2-polyprenyl-3-methyl-5-hydroxy-6-metoxy-1,4-benzoquinol methylase